MADPRDDIRFSVVIAAYNAEQTIAGAIRSCLEQSFPPHEIIVVDDASTDGTVATVRSFGEQVMLVCMERNGGPARARNRGMDTATGTHIAFLDADDTWHPEKLSIIADLFSRHPAVRFIFHPYTLETKDLPVNVPLPPLQRFPFPKLLLRNTIATPCVVMAREPVMRFNEAMRYMEDYDLWLQAAAQYELYRFPLPLTRLGRPVLSKGGQSSDRLAMRRGERTAYRNLAARQPKYRLLLPLLTGLSWLKHFWKQATT
jgi:teichuronic acid biosynthesis glycosyltransferase TuaG